MASSRDWSHQTVLEPAPASAARAREFVVSHLVAHHLTHLVDDVRLVASELATNAVTHARTRFVVTLAETDGSVVLTVQDESTSTPSPGSPGPLDVHGRGLVIVAALSHAWGASTNPRGNKSVWASFSTQHSGVSPTPVRTSAA